MRKQFIKALCLSIFLQMTVAIPNANAIKIINGKKYFAYMVQAGETVESLTSAFKVTKEELLEQNPQAKEGLTENMVIMVPVKENMMNANLPEINVITYKVKPGDTLISLAKTYNSTIDDIIQRNLEELADGILRAGSTIKIAQNSGGLTGGEEAKQKAKAEAEAKKKQQSADSTAQAHTAYWMQPWTIIDVKNPGSIDSLKTEREWRMITRLKVIGTANQTDVAVVGKRIFEFERIKVLDLHDALGIKKIGTKTFEECNSLEAISLPNSIDSIGVKAFTGTNNIQVFRCYALNPPACEEESFANIDFATCTLEVPQAALDKYKSANLWKNFATIKAIPTISNSESKL